MAKSVFSSNTTIDQVRQLLSESRPEEAMKLLSRNRDSSPGMENARAVCLMRMGQAGEAIRILTPLVFLHGSVIISQDAPLMAKVNYATAILLSGNLAGCLVALREMYDENHESVEQLRQAVATWRKSQGVCRRLAMAVGMVPFNARVPLDFPPGAV